MEIKKWLGLKNTSAPERLKPGEMAAAQNIDVDNDNHIASRKGQTLVLSGAFHSLFSVSDQCYLMEAHDLYRLTEDGVRTFITRLTSARPLSYVEAGGVVYFSNGEDTGRIVQGQAREWGIKSPVSQPVAAPYPGTLGPGKYMYAMTFVRQDGLESGTGLAGEIVLETPGGIFFSNLETSTNPEVTGKILYLSTANGTEMYRVATLPPTLSSYAHMSAKLALGMPLMTQFVEPAPKGHIVEIHSGIAYVVDGNVAWYSDAYSFERFRKSESRFLQFSGRVVLFSAVSDGIYVGTESGVWFLQGHEPTNFSSRQVLSYGVIEGTSTKFDEEELDNEGQQTGKSSTAVAWTSPNGIIVGSRGGVVKNLTENKYGFPTAQRGAGVVRATRGFTQYVATLQGTGAAPNIYE